MTILSIWFFICAVLGISVALLVTFEDGEQDKWGPGVRAIVYTGVFVLLPLWLPLVLLVAFISDLCEVR